MNRKKERGVLRVSTYRCSAHGNSCARRRRNSSPRRTAAATPRNPRSTLADIATDIPRNFAPMPAAIPAKENVRAHSRNSPAFSAANPAAAARVSSMKPPPSAIPVIATDTGALLSSPVATITPTTKKAHDANARIIAPENVSTAATVTTVGRFISTRPASQFTQYRQNQ
jgi:hypothetical protein